MYIYYPIHHSIDLCIVFMAQPGYCGKYRQHIKIALVATHADQCHCPKQPSGEMVSGEGNIVLYQTKRLFGRVFDICDVLFVVDAHSSQSKDMKMLRTHISSLRNSVLKVRFSPILYFSLFFGGGGVVGQIV